MGIRPTDKRVQNGRAAADPMCEKEETLKATMGRFKAFAAAAGVEIEGKDSEVVFSELQNRKIVAKVSHTVGRDNPEQTFAKVDRWLPVGTVDPHVTEEAAKHQGGKAPASLRRSDSIWGFSRPISACRMGGRRRTRCARRKRH